jgi:predicted extracellular nuclease
MTRIHFRSVGLLLAAALFAGACDEATGPDGAPTDLTVRVYVDADGSGTFNTGDAPVAGATVTATGQDGEAGGAVQTDAQGVATFSGLRPGSYALTLTGANPAGAVLTTATAPVFTATAQGGTGAAEFRFAYFPNTVNGVLYRDENGNGTFDAGADLPAPGVTVHLFAGTTAAGDPAFTTQTSATGSFSFTGVRPGTYTLRIVAPQGVTIVDGADRTISVPAQTPPVNVAIRFTGNLRVPIATARVRPVGSTVTVEGVVTAGRGQILPRNFYLQDASGGLQVFLPTASPAQPVVGDSVRVTGPMAVFNGEQQISGTAITVEALGKGTVPAPRNLNAAAVLDSLVEGQLVRVDSLEVISIAPTGGPPATGANVNVRTPQGNEFQLRLDNLANVPVATFEVGRVYTVTGVMGSRNNVPQLKPRTTADVQRTSAPTIAEVKAQALGSAVTATGVVTATPGTFSSQYFYIQDRTGGLLVYRFRAGTTLALGDSVSVSGALRNPFGEFQVDTVTRTDSVVVTVIRAGTVPAPRVITGAQLLARTYESELARINDVVITSVGNQSSTTSGFNVTATAPDGTTFTIRADGPTNVERPAFTVGQTYDIVGILTVFNGVAQIKPRSTDDVIAS